MNATLATVLWPQSRSNLLHKAILVVMGTVLLALSSKFNVPFYPVPMTMQTFVVLALSMALGWRLASATLLLYLAEGAFGLPVFAGTPEKGIGLAYMMSGTGGYLLGFMLAAPLCGWLAERGWDRNPLTTAVAMLLGNTVIYIPGVIWLGILFGWDKPILELGIIPFLLGDLTKLALAAAVLPLCWKITGKREPTDGQTD